MPMSRKTSMARWFVMCARGVFAVHRYLVIMMLGTPSVDRKSAAADPAGPDPTMSTSVSIRMAAVSAVTRPDVDGCRLTRRIPETMADRGNPADVGGPLAEVGAERVGELRRGGEAATPGDLGHRRCR